MEPEDWKTRDVRRCLQRTLVDSFLLSISEYRTAHVNVEDASADVMACLK